MHPDLEQKATRQRRIFDEGNEGAHLIMNYISSLILCCLLHQPITRRWPEPNLKVCVNKTT